jgi:hypothetical protein
MSRPSRARRRSFLIGAGLLVALVAAATSAVALKSAQSDLPRRPEVPTEYTSRQLELAPTSTVQEAIDQTLAGFGSEAALVIRAGKPPSADDWPGTWLYIGVKAPSAGDGTEVANLWEADLAQGVIAERLAGGTRNLADVIAGSVITVEGDDGTASEQASASGDISSGQLFDAGGLSDDSIASRIEMVVRQFGLTPVDVAVLRPLGPAARVVVRASDTSGLGKFEDLRVAILGDPYTLEGLYLEIDLKDGTPIVRGATSYRSGTGRLWIAPGYDNAVGAVHGGYPQR